MPVGLSPAAVPTIKSKSVAISTSYPNLSTFRFLPKAARAAGYLPNERRLISASAPVITDDQQGCSRLYRRDSTRACTPYVQLHI